MWLLYKGHQSLRCAHIWYWPCDHNTKVISPSDVNIFGIGNVTTLQRPAVPMICTYLVLAMWSQFKVHLSLSKVHIFGIGQLTTLQRSSVPLMCTYLVLAIWLLYKGHQSLWCAHIWYWPFDYFTKVIRPSDVHIFGIGHLTTLQRSSVPLMCTYLVLAIWLLYRGHQSLWCAHIWYWPFDYFTKFISPSDVHIFGIGHVTTLQSSSVPLMCTCLVLAMWLLYKGHQSLWCVHIWYLPCDYFTKVISPSDVHIFEIAIWLLY